MGSRSIPAIACQAPRYQASYVPGRLGLRVTLPFGLASPAPAAETARQATMTDPSEPCSSRLAECTVTWKVGSDDCKERGASG